MIKKAESTNTNGTNGRLVRNGLVYLTLSGLGSVINFLYNPLSGRLLPPQEYANLGVLNAITLQFSAIFVALGLVVIKIFRDHNQEDSQPKFLATQKYVAKIFLLFILFSVALSPLIKSALHLPDYASLALLVPYALLAIPIMFMGGYHQSRGAFVLMGSYTIFIASSKLASAAVLLYTTPTLLSATWSLVLSQLLGFIFLISFTPRNLTLFHRTKDATKTVIPREDKKYILYTALTVFALLFLSNVDVLIVKNRFEYVSWQYIGPALLTNGIIFITTSIAYVMVSHLKKSENWLQNRKTLLHSLAAWASLIIPVFITVGLFANTIIKYTIGDTYNSMNTREYMVLSVVLYSLIGLLYLISSFLVASGRHIYASIISFTTVVSALAVGLLIGASITDLILRLILIVFLADLTVLFIVIREFRSNEKAT